MIGEINHAKKNPFTEAIDQITKVNPFTTIVSTHDLNQSLYNKMKIDTSFTQTAAEAIGKYQKQQLSLDNSEKYDKYS